MSFPKWIPALLALSLAAGCGREVVGGGQKEVETVAVGDGTPDGAASRSPAEGARWSAAVPQGTLAFIVELSLVAEDGRALPLTAGPRTVEVRLDGSERAPVSVAVVPAMRYAQVRAAFTSVEAEVSAGVLGVTGKVRVGIPPGERLVVVRSVPLPDPDRRETLVLDLNASAWLAAAVGGVVSPAAFEQAVRIRAE